MFDSMYYLLYLRSQDFKSCGVIDLDYSMLSSMRYPDALNYTVSHPMTQTVSCLSHPTGQMKYDIIGTSIVSEVNLN